MEWYLKLTPLYYLLVEDTVEVYLLVEDTVEVYLLVEDTVEVYLLVEDTVEGLWTVFQSFSPKNNYFCKVDINPQVPFT